MIAIVATAILTRTLFTTNVTQQRGYPRRRGPGFMQGQGAKPASPANGADANAMAERQDQPSHWTATEHSITINGEKINYTATCGYLPVRNRQGKVAANMFFVAYTRNGENLHKRPVLFAFNGGPGSSSVWLHMGALGPDRVDMTYHGHLPKPPYKWVPNQQSWLPFTDIVMLDAVGTGYSNTVTPGDSEFFGPDGDLAAFTSAITAYDTMETRWLSPTFVLGESYGGFRVAGLSQTLLSAGVACNGIISLSGVLNMPTIDGGKDNDLPYISFLPSECGVAWYHHKLSPAFQVNLVATQTKAEEFAQGEYAHALMMGSALPKAEEDKVAATLSSFIGIPKSFILKNNLRIPDFEFMGVLLRNDRESTGRYDGRIIGQEQTGNQTYPDYDASDSAVAPVFTACINDYLKTNLKFKTDKVYKIMGNVYPWDDSRRNDTSDALREAMTKNPYMKTMFCFGRFDLACPFFGTIYVIRHMNLPPNLASNIHIHYFMAGHMVYTDTPSRIKFQKNGEEFIQSCLNAKTPPNSPSTPEATH